MNSLAQFIPILKEIINGSSGREPEVSVITHSIQACIQNVDMLGCIQQFNSDIFFPHFLPFTGIEVPYLDILKV